MAFLLGTAPSSSRRNPFHWANSFSVKHDVLMCTIVVSNSLNVIVLEFETEGRNCPSLLKVVSILLYHGRSSSGPLTVPCGRSCCGSAAAAAACTAFRLPRIGVIALSSSLE